MNYFRERVRYGDYFIMVYYSGSFYAITLNIYGGSSRWRSSQRTFTVKLEGNDGMAETVMKLRCNSCRYSYDKHRFHKLFVSHDIGRIKKVQITVSTIHKAKHNTTPHKIYSRTLKTAVIHRLYKEYKTVKTKQKTTTANFGIFVINA